MRFRAVLLLGVLAAAGCRPATSDESEAPARGTAEALGLAEQSGPLGPEALALEYQRKLAEAGPLAVVREVEPRALDGRPRTTAPELAATARAVLADVAFPVLVPDDPALLEVAQPTTGADWYGISMTRDAHTVYLHATRVTHRLPVPLEAAPGAPSPESPRVAYNEAGPVLTFTAGGASYSLFVECEAPLTDPRCVDEAYVRELGDGLALLEGGRP